MDGDSTRNPDKQKEKLANPLISVITVVYNGFAQIEETIRSVIKHSHKEAEYIVIDGGSSDGTVEIIRKYEAHIRFWISEPDRGIYDAINKGINASSGSYFLVLNAGDQLLYLPLDEVRQSEEINADVILFDVRCSDNRVFRSVVDYRTRFGNTIHHQGALYRRTLNINYDTSYRVYADFDMNLKLLAQKKKFIKFNKVITYHSLDGVSNNRGFIKEYFDVIKNNSGPLHTLIGYLYFKQGELRKSLRQAIDHLHKGNGL